MEGLAAVIFVAAILAWQFVLLWTAWGLDQDRKAYLRRTFIIAGEQRRAREIRKAADPEGGAFQGSYPGSSQRSYALPGLARRAGWSYVDHVAGAWRHE